MNANPLRFDPIAAAQTPPPGDGAIGVRCSCGDVIQPDHLEQIEALDDVIFSALKGDAAALDQSARLYRATARATPQGLLDESREQYLRRAESIVQSYQRSPGKALGKTFAALEILTLIAED
jgi:hypothetical protein